MVWTLARFSPAPVGRSSRSRLRRTQGACVYATAQVSIAGGLRGACSGRSKSQNLVSNHGIAFGGGRPERGNGKNTCQPLLQPFLAASNTSTTTASSFPRSYSYGHYYCAYVDHCVTCVVILYACMRCLCTPCTCACVYGSVHDAC